jgi:hypothetical protein
MSEAVVLTGHNIEILPFNINPDKLSIVKTINDHAKVSFSALVPEGEKDKYIQQAKTQTGIEINHADSSRTTCLFKGIITNIEVKAVRDIYYVYAQAVSYTYNLDIKLKRRSFQKESMSYDNLIEEVIGDSGDYKEVASKGKNIEKFIIQYDETDWVFLKRMASHFYAGLVADACSDKPKFWFGVPEGGGKGNLEEFNYSVSKKIGDFRVSSENYIEGIDEKDFIYYKIVTDKLLNIGDKISFDKKNLVVSQLVAEMSDGVLTQEYTLTPEKGMSQKLILNDNVMGASVEGKVIKVEEDKVKLHLEEIDEVQQVDEAFWFPYSTCYTAEGQTGWYCMPELDDYVKLYFPNNKEEEGVVIGSIRKKTKGGDFIKDPEVKFFRTKFGKEIMFSEKDIVITGKDEEVLIRLNEEEGIEIYSKKDIKIKADEEIKISGKTIYMSAGSKIDIQCKNSQIEMSGETIIKGDEVKTN